METEYKPLDNHVLSVIEHIEQYKNHSSQIFLELGRSGDNELWNYFRGTFALCSEELRSRSENQDNTDAICGAIIYGFVAAHITREKISKDIFQHFPESAKSKLIHLKKSIPNSKVIEYIKNI
jgi:hypothetical protein